MKLRFFNPSHLSTKYVKFNSRKCKACWECIGICPNNVIGKVDLPWHKHALLVNGENCSGCLKCTRVCSYGAYQPINI